MNQLSLPAVRGLAEARQVWTEFSAIISIEDVGVEEDRSFRFPSGVGCHRCAILQSASIGSSTTTSGGKIRCARALSRVPCTPDSALVA